MMLFLPQKSPARIAIWLCLISYCMVGTRASCSGTPYFGACWVQDTDAGTWLECEDVGEATCATICDNSAIYPSKCTTSDKNSGGGGTGGGKDVTDSGGDEDWNEKDSAVQDDWSQEQKDSGESKEGGKPSETTSDKSTGGTGGKVVTNSREEEGWNEKDGAMKDDWSQEQKDGGGSKEEGALSETTSDKNSGGTGGGKVATDGGGEEDWNEKDGAMKDNWSQKQKDGGESNEGGGPSASFPYAFEHTWNGVMTTRSYALHAPRGDRTPAVMVIVFYGCLSGLPASNDILVVCPSPGATGDWKALEGDSEDVDFVAGLLDSLGDRHGIPADKRVLTGFSYGGSMAYRVLCERVDAIGGIVPYGQAFFEPSTGHVEKGAETAGATLTDQAIAQNVAARKDGTKKCDVGSQQVPHRALVGTADNYYGEAGGVYAGKALWEDFSANVYGCEGAAEPPFAGAASDTGAGRAGSECYQYSGGCPGLADAALNQYCIVDGMGHDTIGWEEMVAMACLDFFATADEDKENGSNDSMLQTKAGFVISISVMLTFCIGLH